MVPASFDESNAVLDKPPLMANCEALSILRTKVNGGPCVVSCWKMSAEERDEIIRTGRVWLMIAGNTMPPAALCGFKPTTV